MVGEVRVPGAGQVRISDKLPKTSSPQSPKGEHEVDSETVPCWSILPATFVHYSDEAAYFDRKIFVYSKFRLAILVSGV